MKLALAISNHGNMLGGGEYSFLEFISRLKPNWRAVATVPFNGELAQRLRQQGIETHTVALPPIRPWRIANIVSTLATYLRLGRSHRPALIYANGSRAALYGGFLGQLLKLPVIWHCRIAERDPFADPLLIRLSNKIVVNSKATGNRFPPRIKDKVKVIYNGVDIEWLQHKSVKIPDLIHEDWKVILVVARASKWKRHDLILALFELAASKDSAVHLVCIGERDRSEPRWWSYLQEITHRSEYSDRIHWIGPVEDVRPWYRSSFVLVLASENEPFGRVLVEAMATGVVVVAPMTGGIPEIVRSGRDGLLTPAGDVKEMANAVSRILKDESLRKRLAMSARDRVKLFDLDNQVDKMIRTFEEATQ